MIKGMRSTQPPILNSQCQRRSFQAATDNRLPTLHVNTRRDRRGRHVQRATRPCVPRLVRLTGVEEALGVIRVCDREAFHVHLARQARSRERDVRRRPVAHTDVGCKVAEGVDEHGPCEFAAFVDGIAAPVIRGPNAQSGSGVTYPDMYGSLMLSSMTTLEPLVPTASAMRMPPIDQINFRTQPRTQPIP
jgi:hypothetical protein